MPPVFSRESGKTYIINDSRAGQAHASPCENACPLRNPIQKMEKALADGDAPGALYALRASNPFPGVTGRVCPHPCESRCNRAERDEGMAIRSLERFAADHGAAGLRQPVRRPASGKRIAVIGSGPAGMAAAWYSALLGHEVTVFEASPVAGGTPRLSIPDFRLPKDVVDHEVGIILSRGVRVLTNVEVGKDLALSDIMREFDACLAAVGNRRERRLDIPGIEKSLAAVEFLRANNLARSDLSGKKVVVLGGGGVAFDCAFTARRLGAESVALVCLENRDALRVPAAEVEQADDEGIAIHGGNLAAAVELDAAGEPRAVRARRVDAFHFDEGGNLHAEFADAPETVLPADVVICASGLMPDHGFLRGAGELAEVARTPRGGIAVTGAMSSVPGFFAAGECATGPSLVSSAIASGRRAAFDMDAWLRGEEPAPALDAWLDEEGRIQTTPLPEAAEQKEVAFADIVNDSYRPRAPRRSTKSKKAAETFFAFEELDQGLPPEDAAAEAGRCLHCGHCQTCGECVASCPGLILEMGESSPVVRYPDECWHCGCCRLACPGGCISFKFPLHTFL